MGAAGGLIAGRVMAGRGEAAARAAGLAEQHAAEQRAASLAAERAAEKQAAEKLAVGAAEKRAVVGTVETAASPFVRFLPQSKPLKAKRLLTG